MGGEEELSAPPLSSQLQHLRPLTAGTKSSAKPQDLEARLEECGGGVCGTENSSVHVTDFSSSDISISSERRLA